MEVKPLCFHRLWSLWTEVNPVTFVSSDHTWQKLTLTGHKCAIHFASLHVSQHKKHIIITDNHPHCLTPHMQIHHHIRNIALHIVSQVTTYTISESTCQINILTHCWYIWQVHTSSNRIHPHCLILMHKPDMKSNTLSHTHKSYQDLRI
jgi:hypothetical protein